MKYILLDIQKKLIIKFFVLFIIFIIIIKKYFNRFFFGAEYDEIKIKYADTILSSENTKGEYPGYDKLILNYKNKCSKYFKFRKNSRKDIVIFAGKGHETYQEINKEKHAFDERKIIQDILKELENQPNKKKKKK